MPPIWKGSLAFGLVNIPVELRSAIRVDRMAFRLLHAVDLAPIRYERVCTADGDPVPWSEIVKGYEYEHGKFVVMTDDDFHAAASVSSHVIEIIDFVQHHEIDPRYFATPYAVIPARGGEHAYALLREAIHNTGTVGIGKITLRNKQHLASVGVVNSALVLELMRFDDELVDLQSLDLPPQSSVRDQELHIARELIASLTRPFDAAQYGNEYHANIVKLVRAKLRGKRVALPAPVAESPAPQVIDLVSRLRESVERGRREAQRERGKRTRGTLRSGRKAAAARERSRPRKNGNRSA